MPGPCHSGSHQLFTIPLFPSSILPGQFGALPGGVSAASVANSLRLRYYTHFSGAIIQRRLGSRAEPWQAFAGWRQDSVGGPGNEGPHRSPVGAATRAATRANRWFPLLSAYFFPFNFPGAWFFLPIVQVAGRTPYLIPPPSPRQKAEPSGITCSEKGVFFFLSLFF